MTSDKQDEEAFLPKANNYDDVELSDLSQQKSTRWKAILRMGIEMVMGVVIVLLLLRPPHGKMISNSSPIPNCTSFWNQDRAVDFTNIWECHGRAIHFSRTKGICTKICSSANKKLATLSTTGLNWVQVCQVLIKQKQQLLTQLLLRWKRICVYQGRRIFRFRQTLEPKHQRYTHHASIYDVRIQPATLSRTYLS